MGWGHFKAQHLGILNLKIGSRLQRASNKPLLQEVRNPSAHVVFPTHQLWNLGINLSVSHEWNKGRMIFVCTSSMPGLYLLDASSTPSSDNLQCVQISPSVPAGRGQDCPWWMTLPWLRCSRDRYRGGGSQNVTPMPSVSHSSSLFPVVHDSLPYKSTCLFLLKEAKGCPEQTCLHSALWCLNFLLK